MRKTDCHGTDGGIHGDFGADHLASGRHGNTHCGENGRCQQIPAGGPLRYLSGKYLVTITGYVAFTYLIPIACGLWILNLIFANATVRKLAAKLAVFGLAISLVVPASVKISDLIGDTYQAQIETSIEDAKNTQNILENSGVVDDTNAKKQLESEQQKLLKLLQVMCRRRKTITPDLSQTFSTGQKTPFPVLKIRWQMLWKM